MFRNRTRAVTLGLSFVLSLMTFRASTEDIDIFSVDQSNTVGRPNVLIVLDNSANWSRQSQQWPGGIQQGQSEVRAITRVLNELPDGAFNLGLMEFITGGSSGDTDSGFVRFDIRPMSATNKATLSNILYGPSADGDPIESSIFSNINDPDEKRSQGNPFGNLFWDIYNYLAGDDHSNAGAGTLDALSDDEAYTTKHSVFESPLSVTDACSRTIVIFIGNNVQAGPTGDSTANVNALTALGGDTDQILFADYVVATSAEQDRYSLGTSACFESASACNSAVASADVDGNGLSDCSDGGYTSCFCDETTAQSCDQPARYSAFGRSVSQEIVSGPTSTVGGSVEGTGQAPVCLNPNETPDSLTCPTSAPLAGSTFANGPNPGQVTETNTSWSSCAYVEQQNACGKNNTKDQWTPKGIRTTTTTVREITEVDTALGPTTSCAVEETGCDTTTLSGCPGSGTTTYDSCFCSGGADTSGCAAGTTSRFAVVGNYNRTAATATGTFSTPPTQGGSNFMTDEWSRFLRSIGVPIPGTAELNDGEPVRAQVTTYTIDVFNEQQDADFSALLFNTARVGGGKYYQARNEDSIVAALSEIFAEVQAVNTAFASASLPVSATNRAQNENQVFIGLFRPDRTARPQWFGNLKRFQIIADQGGIRLGDKNGNAAVNSQTGFLTECSASFWTEESGTYWNTVSTDDPPAQGLCPGASSPWSDLPDGPFVEKGAVAEVLRRGNDRGALAVSGNFAVNRNIKTLSGSTLVDYTADCSLDDDGDVSTDASDAERVKCFMRGEDRSGDQPDADLDGNLTEPRSTIHGDVVHSRPQPVNFGGDTGVVVYYGANDGTLRAVQSGTDEDGGEELWAFLAPEHQSRFERLRNNAPNILYDDGDPTTPAPVGAEPKDYFFDGTIGLLQRADDSEISIFPSMRRGGRRIYKFDVTAAKDDATADPVFRWRKGCNDATDASCDTGFTEIGETWSQPSPAFVANYVDDSEAVNPVVVLGGGYDRCEDANTNSPSCSGAKGSGVYVLDSGTGAIIRHFDFDGRSVAADVALVDVTSDGKVDLGYAVTTGGEVWRIDFRGDDKDDWEATAVAFTSGMYHKFLFRPALLQTKIGGQPAVYLAIGTGDREHPLRGHYPFPDAASGRVGVKNRFYVFKDEPNNTLAALDLNGMEMSDNTDPVGGLDGRQCEADEILPTSTQRGWYIDLDERGNGEQVVTSAVIAAGGVFFSTNRADEEAAGNELACTNSLGEARGYAVALLSGQGLLGGTGCGTRSGEFTGGGLPPSPVIATVPVTGTGRVETICLGCITSPGGGPGEDDDDDEPACVPGSPIEACLVNIDFPAVRKPLYWYTIGDTE